MTTYNTGNPIGSTDARDRLDNTENMDILENSTTLDSHPDRLGTVRKTRHGMEVEHDAQIAAHEAEHDAQMQSFENDFDSRLAGTAFTRVGTFTAGATLTDMRQTLLWEVSQGGDGHEYGWTGSFLPSGKLVVAGSTPATSGGIGAGSWVVRTDVTLRSDLASESGSGLVGYQPAGNGAVATTVQSKLRETVSVKDFGAVGDGVTDDTAAIQSAVNYAVSNSKGKIFCPAGLYKISDTIDFYAAGTPDAIEFCGTGAPGESATASGASGTVFIWYGANDRAVFQALGKGTRGLKFSGFNLSAAGTYGSPTNPYKDGFWIGPTSGFSAHKVVFESLLVRDYTAAAFRLGDPEGSTYNGQMANSSMRDVSTFGYLPDAKAIWAKGGTSEDFYIYNLVCGSISGDDKKNFITTESGFFINIYGLLTDGIDDVEGYFSIQAVSSVSVYQWITEDLRLYNTTISAYGHPIVLSGVRMLSSSGRHGGTVRDAVVWKGGKNTPNAWDDVPVMSLLGCTFNGNVRWSSGIQSQMSAIGVTFAAGDFVYEGSNSRGLNHNAVKGTLALYGPDVAFEQFTENRVSRIKFKKGATYYRRNTLAGPTANTNNFPLGDTGTYFRLTPSGGVWTITGFDNGDDGRMAIIHNASSARDFILAHEDAGSSAENRIVTPTRANVTIPFGHHAQLIYDSPTSRWLLINVY